MQKCMIDVYIPAANKHYDVRVPLDSRIGEILPLLEKSFEELEPGYYVAKNDSVLCDGQNGMILDVTATIREVRLINGSKVMLV